MHFLKLKSRWIRISTTRFGVVDRQMRVSSKNYCKRKLNIPPWEGPRLTVRYSFVDIPATLLILFLFDVLHTRTLVNHVFSDEYDDDMGISMCCCSYFDCDVYFGLLPSAFKNGLVGRSVGR